jgi:hypothetical protein
MGGGFLIICIHSKEIDLLRWAWWYTPVISALRGLKQKNHKFEASLYYILSLKPAWAT